MPKPLFSHVLNLRTPTIGTSGLADGSVTYAKLAPDAQLWQDTGTALTPGTNFAARPVVAVPGDGTGATALLGTATAKARLQGFTSANGGSVGLFANRNWLASNAQDDATKPSWGLQLNLGTDNLLVQRSPAGSTTQTNVLGVDNAGNLTITGAVATKAAPGTAWVNPSDPRLKRDVGPYQIGLDAIRALHPITFKYNGLGGTVDDDVECHGFDTAAVRDVMPDCIRTQRAKLRPDDAHDTDIAMMDVSDILLALVNAVQELATRVAALEGKA